MALKAVIFDVDGVIIDTAPLHHKSWEIVLKRDYNMKFTFKDFKNKIDGMPRAKGVKALLPDADDKEVQRICDEKQKYFEILLKKNGVKIFKSTVNLILKLKKEGIKVAMASSSRNARPILEREGIFKYFDIDAEGALAKKGKPHPDIFLRAAKKLKVKPSECAVFEDAQIGIDAANAAGMKSIGVIREHELKKTDLNVKDMRQATVEKIRGLF
ncbi:MAG: Beta-phosphoglucomutase [Candidatus Aerophobetes bacterium ADurb.Bin490]|nr:MAG: Beta-phosphoglucomutase [Candidatus Aerophobetes bacterium ADurb.Bin490]HNZ28483.1 beta-phosphoglucomutase family hydrolase [Candidatus Goldiibacteriota bacterium]HPI02983.1 beta-phosphoglucomutase family hydrolase [Candidatus Goldiibacteriota bacterium]HPN64109.1 beta-phosphoglucomutase family hydrolase [Candidatus Goldiibacteriota bacterium]HRQ44685.1 beta-phosphoglucomutase family hydrolase [Candidatus Goldiibacteriota bacterium]